MIMIDQYLNKPIDLIGFSMQNKFTLGNLSVAIDTSRSDELGSMAKSFDIMRIKLQQHISKIEAKNEQLQNIMQKIYVSRLNAMEDLGSGAAHEINQPLSIIKLKTERLLNIFSPNYFAEKRDYETLRALLKENILQVKRADDVIQKMHIVVKNEPESDLGINIKESVELVLSLFKKQSREDNIMLETDLPDDLPPAKCSPRAFRIIVLNLFRNARFAANKKANNTVEIDYKKRITTSLAYDDSIKAVIFEMKNNGIGMEPEEKDRCLEPFFTTKEVNEGIGMGLFIVYRITKELNMKIEIESDKTNGSLFRILMPIAIKIK